MPASPPPRWRPSRHVVPLLLAIVAVTTASAGGYGWVRVHSGTTLSEIAHHHHTTVGRLVALNHLAGDGDLIYAGSRLRVPVHGRDRHTHHAHAVHRRPAQHARRVVSHYRVRPGDSLDSIAARWHVPAARIARANHLPASQIVQLGQRLRIPHRARHAAHHRSRNHGTDGSSGTVPALRTRLAHARVPGPAQMERIIARTARHFHVDPAFALAISWQESGFDQRVVSGIGAIGAMQVMPASGDFVATYIVHHPLNLMKARPNVTAGVGLLSALLTDTHRDRRLAAAGYYQGLASVRAHGLFSDTRRYVADVLALRRRFAG